MNGPFAIVVARPDMMLGITDGSSSALVAGENGKKLYISSEEAAIRRMDPEVGEVSMPRAGYPVIGRVES